MKYLFLFCSLNSNLYKSLILKTYIRADIASFIRHTFGVVENSLREAGVCMNPCRCWSLLWKGAMGTGDASIPLCGILQSLCYSYRSARAKDLRKEKEAALPMGFIGSN